MGADRHKGVLVGVAGLMPRFLGRHAENGEGPGVLTQKDQMSITRPSLIARPIVLRLTPNAWASSSTR
jgi:hypothetical protein